MKKYNRRYKDSVFVDLFSNDRTAKTNFLSLYNTLQLPDTKYNAITSLKNMRLTQTMYMGFANDVSYLVDNKIIVLAEHQSTINPNMPIRCLEYIARLYEQLYESKEKYHRKLLSIPTPEFYVFYNGVASYTGNPILKLSNSFINKQKTEYALELSVKVVNINYHKDNQLLKNCKILRGYSLFIETVRHHIAVDREHGFDNAIKECIKKDILREYLQRKSKEVINMLIGEYDYDTDIAVQREESFDIGLKQGKAEGLRQAKLETVKTMLTMGYPLDDICKITSLSPTEVSAIGRNL